MVEVDRFDRGCVGFAGLQPTAPIPGDVVVHCHVSRSLATLVGSICAPVFSSPSGWLSRAQWLSVHTCFPGVSCCRFKESVGAPSNHSRPSTSTAPFNSNHYWS